MSVKIEFNEELHQYKVNGLVVPSVSELLQEAGIIGDMTFADPTLGSAVHKACSYDDAGTLPDDYDCEPVLIRLNGWRKFRRDHSPMVLIENERPMFSKLGFCGTVDRIYSYEGSTILADIKTSKIWQRSTILQLLAYKRLAEEAGYKIDALQIIYLDEMGGYKIIPVPILDSDWNIFLKILAIRAWRLKK